MTSPGAKFFMSLTYVGVFLMCLGNFGRASTDFGQVFWAFTAIGSIMLASCFLTEATFAKRL